MISVGQIWSLVTDMKICSAKNGQRNCCYRCIPSLPSVHCITPCIRCLLLTFLMSVLWKKCIGWNGNQARLPLPQSACCWHSLRFYLLTDGILGVLKGSSIMLASDRHNEKTAINTKYFHQNVTYLQIQINRQINKTIHQQPMKLLFSNAQQLTTTEIKVSRNKSK